MDLSDAVFADDHSYGPASALVTMVEYADFDCRFCTEAYPVVQELSARFAPYLRVVFRHSPRSHEHSRSGLAAEAAEAAAEQGKFWQMHDCLFEHPSSLEALDLFGYAQMLGLDVEKFADAMCRRGHRPRVRRDQLTGIRSRVISTPAFFINGKRFSEGADRGALAAAIVRIRSHVTSHLCDRRFSSVAEALAHLLAITSSLRDAYKRFYWRCLPLPFAQSRMLCGQHAREQSELAAQLAQRADLFEQPSTSAHSTPETTDSELLSSEFRELDSWFVRLLGMHEVTITTAHSVANRLAELGDAAGHDWITGHLLLVNECQAQAIARRILAARCRPWRVTNH